MIFFFITLFNVKFFELYLVGFGYEYVPVSYEIWTLQKWTPPPPLTGTKILCDTGNPTMLQKNVIPSGTTLISEQFHTVNAAAYVIADVLVFPPSQLLHVVETCRLG